MNTSPPQNDATIQVVAERISSLHEDVTYLRNDMRESYKEMSEAIKSLIRLKEKQMTLYVSYEELKKNQTEQERRIDALEKQQPETQRVIAWAYRAIWGAAVTIAVFVAKSVGIM